MTGTSASISNANMNSIANNINSVISQLKSDPKISDCVNGRNTTNIRGTDTENSGRFPNLLDSYILEIINSGLDTARSNYNTKVEELKTQAMNIAQKNLEDSTLPQCVSPYVLKDIDAYKDKVTIKKFYSEDVKMTTINKNFCALLCGFAVYVFSVSGAFAACSGNDIEIDKVNGKRYGCKCSDRYNRTDYASGSGINGGFKIFDSFPAMKYCYSAADDRWKGNGTTMCSGFSYSNYDSATMDTFAYRKK